MKSFMASCLCGHSKHFHYNRNGKKGCIVCWDRNERLGLTQHKAHHDFKLDNLAYVEQVARARGLV